MTFNWALRAGRRLGAAWTRKARAAVPALVSITIATGAVAEVGPGGLPPRDLFTDRLQREGNRISFCYNPEGMMAKFELALAEAIGAALLVEIRTVPMPKGLGAKTTPFDYRIPILPEQLYILLAERCSAFIGYALSRSAPEWLLVSRPYMSAPMVFVTRDPDIERLEDLPVERPVGSRSMSMADNRLINFIQARPEGRQWRRHAYYSNDVVVERLKDGTVGAGLVWEPALNRMTGGDPEGQGFFRLAQEPFAAPPVEIGIATRTENRYLNESLGEAIAALVADGTVDRLLEEHGLLAVDGS